MHVLPPSQTILDEEGEDVNESAFVETRREWFSRFEHLQRALWRCELQGEDMGTHE